MEQFKQNVNAVYEKNVSNSTFSASENLTKHISENRTNYSIDCFESQRQWWWSIFTSEYTVGYYSLVFVLLLVFTISRSLAFYRWCLTAATRLHHTMFNNIVYSPMRFFNFNPTGRILNRFSKDIGCLDETLPMTILDTVQVSILAWRIITVIIIIFIDPLIIIIMI